MLSRAFAVPLEGVRTNSQLPLVPGRDAPDVLKVHAGEPERELSDVRQKAVWLEVYPAKVPALAEGEVSDLAHAARNDELPERAAREAVLPDALQTRVRLEDHLAQPLAAEERVASEALYAARDREAFDGAVLEQTGRDLLEALGEAQHSRDVVEPNAGEYACAPVRLPDILSTKGLCLVRTRVLAALC